MKRSAIPRSPVPPGRRRRELLAASPTTSAETQVSLMRSRLDRSTARRGGDLTMTGRRRLAVVYERRRAACRPRLHPAETVSLAVPQILLDSVMHLGWQTQRLSLVRSAFPRIVKIDRSPLEGDRTVSAGPGLAEVGPHRP